MQTSFGKTASEEIHESTGHGDHPIYNLVRAISNKNYRFAEFMKKVHKTEEGQCPPLERSPMHQLATFKTRRDAGKTYQATNTETLS